MQTDATLLANNSQNCWMLHVASVCTPCCMLLDVVAQSLKPVKLFSQQLPTFLLFHDRWSVTQQCWIRLHSSSNIVGATHAHYTWFTKTYGLYPSYDALQVPTLLGVVSAVCTPLPTHTQQLPTLLVQCLHAALSLFSSISGLEKFFQFQTFPSCDLLTILLVALSSWSFPVTILINSSKRTKRAATTSLKQMDWRIMILADFVTNSGRNLWLSWHFWIKNNTFK